MANRFANFVQGGQESDDDEYQKINAPKKVVAPKTDAKTEAAGKQNLILEFGNEAPSGEYRGRGGRGRGARGGRGRGEGRGRGGRGFRGRGGRGGYHSINEAGEEGAAAYNDKQDDKGRYMQDRQDHRWEGQKAHGRQYDKQNASGFRGERRTGNKEGHGRGDWGNTNYEGQKTENKNAEDALQTVEKLNTDEAAKEEEKFVEEPEPVEEEVNNLTYAELKAQRAGAKTFKKEARAPEELKIDQKIEKKERKGEGYTSKTTDLTGGEKYIPNQLESILGFNAGAAASKDEEFEARPARGGRGGRGGRGRGERGRGGRGGRGGAHFDGKNEEADTRAPQRGGKGGHKAFNAAADDFPAL